MQPDYFGPEISFGKRISPYGKIGIIKGSVNATNLAVDWSPTRAGSLYFKMLDMIQTAKVTKPIKIAGIVWMQGESDAKDAAMAKNYGANLVAFIQAWRRDLADQSIPFAACRVNPPHGEFPYAADVRAGEEGVTLPG